MTYSDAIAQRGQRLRLLVKVAGFDRYLATWAGSYDDSAGGNTHGSLTIEPTIVDFSISGGAVDHANNYIGTSTISLTVQDSSWLRGILSRRVAVQQGLAAAATAAATQFSVGDKTAFAVGSYAYVGRECVKVTAQHVSLEQITVTRAQLDTVAAAHPAGMVIATTPRQSAGLRCRVVLGSRDAAGTWQYSDVARTMYLDGSPSFADGLWSMTLSDGAKFFDRSFGLGAETVDVLYYDRTSTEPTLRIYPADDRSFTAPGSGLKGCAWLEFGDRVGVFRITTYGSGFLQFDLFEPSLIPVSGGAVTLAQFLDVNPYEAGSFTRAGQGDRIQHVISSHALCGDPNPAVFALMVMLSDLGDGTASATYDKLPGVAGSSTQAPVRYGAGLTTDVVDVAAWEAAGQIHAPTRQFIIRQTESLLEFLKKDVAPLLGGYVFVNYDGQLSFKKYEPATTAATTTLTITDTNAIGSDNAVDDEGPLIARMTIRSGYNWQDQRFELEQNGIFVDADHTHGDDAKTIVVESRMSGLTILDAQVQLSAYRSRWGQGAQRYSVVVPWSGSLVEPGDSVRFTNSRIPNFEGGQGVTSQICEVTATAPDVNAGTVRLELVRRTTCQLIAPCFELDSNTSGTTWACTPLYYSGANIAAEWAAGWKVKIIDPATGTVNGDNEIDSITANSVTFSNSTAAYSPDDVVIFDDHDDATGDTVNTYAGAEQQDHAFVSTTSYNPDPGDRWG